MNDEEKIKRLQQLVENLLAEMNGYKMQLRHLQQQVDQLQKNNAASKKLKKQTRSFRLENFVGLKLIHLVGIVVLVIGLSIGVKYFIDRELISEKTRILLAYIAGIILYFLSWRLKKKYQLFSAILFSGGMASLYFTTYAAFVYYGFFSFALAFIIMASFTVFTVFKSIRYNRQEIAVLGMVGAYGIPFLISANQERADLFFSYIILINIGIVFLSFKKKWQIMGQLALFISWTILILWGFFKYTGNELSLAVILIIIFYVMFSTGALAYRFIRAQSLASADIQQIIANNIALYLSALIVFSFGEFGKNAAVVTGGYAAFMLVFALFSYLFFSSEIILQKVLAMQAVIAITMFIGFQWNGLAVTLAWTIFSVALFFWGISTHRTWPRLTSILLIAVTLGKLVIFDSSKFTTVQKILAYLIIGSLLLILSFYYQKFKNSLFDNKEQPERVKDFS